MDEYIKYDELKDKVDKFKLTELGIDSRVKNDFYAHYNDLQGIRAIEEANGVLIEEDQSKKEAYMRAIDHWIANFIEDRKKNINENVAKFEDEIDWLLKKLQELKAMFALNGIVVEDVNQIIKGIDKEFEGLIGQATELRDELDGLKDLASGYTDGLDFTATYTDIMKKLNSLRDKIKEIKKDQIAKYNANVKSTNEVIEKTKSEFANKEGLSDDVLADLAKLETLDECTYSLDGKSYNNKAYMEHLDYEKLKQMLLLLNQIREKTKAPAPAEEVELEADMKYIEDKLVEIEGKIKDSMTMDEINPLLEGLTHVEGKITEFEVKLKAYKEKISEEKYNEYEQRVEAARKKLAELRQKLFERIPDLYKALSAELESLNKDVSHLEFYVNALFGKITKDALPVYDERLNFYDGRLNEIKERIEKAKESGKLEDNQYNELKKRVEEIEKKLEAIRAKTKDPKIIAEIEEMDIYDFFNEQIDGIENSINELKNKLNGLEEPIRDRKLRKEIEKKFKAIEQEIEVVEKQLDRYQDKDPDKYEAAKKRLADLKGDLSKLEKKYISMCPLLVKTWKKVTPWIKKHKNVLIVAGLSAMVLLLGHSVIIPAIMQSNLMLGTLSPALSGFANFSNNILGGLIGAAKTPRGIWYLANGVRLNADLAASSLLKGLAAGAAWRGALYSPLIASGVIGVKKLIEKIKKSRLKGEHEDPEEKEKEEEEEKKTKKKKKKEEKNEKDIDKLFKKYLKVSKNGTKMSIEEFCKEHNLSDEEKKQLYIELKKFIENLTKDNSYEEEMENEEKDTKGRGGK